MTTIHNEGTSDEYMVMDNEHTMGFISVNKRNMDEIRVHISLWEDSTSITLSPAQVQELINYLQKQLK